MTNTRANSAPILSPEEVAQLLVEPTLALTQATQAATVIRTNASSYRVPMITKNASTGWVRETEEIPVDDEAFDELRITFSKLAGLRIISNELANDSTPQATQAIGNRLALELSAQLDAAFFQALPDPAPSGLAALAGVSTIDATKGITNLDVFLQAMSNAEVLGTNVTSFVASPADALTLAQLKQGSASNVPLLGADPTQPTRRLIGGVPLLVSASVTPGTVWAIPKDRALIVVREDASVEADSSPFFTSDRTAVRGIMRAGIGFTQPASITKITTKAA